MVKYDMISGKLYDIAYSYKDTRPTQYGERYSPQKIEVIAFRESGSGWVDLCELGDRTFVGLDGETMGLKEFKEFILEKFRERYGRIESISYLDEIGEHKKGIEQKFGSIKN